METKRPRGSPGNEGRGGRAPAQTGHHQEEQAGGGSRPARADVVQPCWVAPGGQRVRLVFGKFCKSWF